MLLHIVVPGLLWPKDSVGEITRGLELPALHALLGRGRRARGPALSPERWLCGAFGVAGDERRELPIGALRWLGEGRDPGADAWLCADPVHLRFSRNTLVVDAAGPDLAADEAAQLAAALNEHLADFGEFLAPHPRRWYLRAKAAPRIATHPPAAVAGRTLEPFLPQGEDARDWRRLINEAQVILHNHAVNAAREAAGRPTANSLWPWGAGALPAAADAPAAHVHVDHPLALGLAKLARIPAAPPPAHFDAAVPAGLTFLETLSVAAQSLDAAAWRAGLAELEARWFAPMLAALKARRLHGLRLTALGDEATVDITLEAGDLRRFWRRPKRLADLLA
ncbi:MAG: hypothetical protein EFKGCFLK_01666 [Rhodocyclaceae bacterium]|nr:hypothetical protein [Rhodocyclaceae bacterium]CAG0933269.1 hypothetical protein RHDC3_02515 [Rhodocyclaceae bacterium]